MGGSLFSRRTRQSNSIAAPAFQAAQSEIDFLISGKSARARISSTGKLVDHSTFLLARICFLFWPWLRFIWEAARSF